MDESSDEQGPLNHWEEIFKVSESVQQENFAEVFNANYGFSQGDFAYFLPKKSDITKFTKEANAQLANLENLQKKQQAKQKPQTHESKVDFSFQSGTDQLKFDVLEMMEISQQSVSKHMDDPENVAWIKAAIQNQKDIVEAVGRGMEEYWNEEECTDSEFDEGSELENDWQKRAEILPKNPDPQLISALKGYIASEFEGQILSKQEEARIIGLSYNATQIIQKHPELYKVDFANAGVLKVLPSIARFAFGAVMDYVKGVAIKQISEIFSKQDDLEHYALEKSKHKDENKSKSKPAEGTTVGFGGGLETEPDPDDEERKKAAAKQFKLDVNNPTDRRVLENLNTSAEDFISKYRKGSVRSEFPGQYLNKSVREVMEDEIKKIKPAQKAKKLLVDSRFTK